MSNTIVQLNLVERKPTDLRDQLRASLGIEEMARWAAQLEGLRWHELHPEHKFFYKERARNVLVQFNRVWGDNALSIALKGGDR